MIEAENLTKVYNGTVKAVNDISFSVNEGELFGFLGPNGAGKTTTIKMLTTLASITQGRATIAGHDVSKNPDAVRKSIGIVQQDLTVDDELTGTENIMLAASLYHVPRAAAKKRAEELLGLVELKDAANRLVRTYSGGMRKRLQLIVGLIHQPRLLFLDEPTLGLDIQTRTVMWDHIKALNKEQKMTIFMTTHYLEEADSLCDRIAIIDHGKIEVSGSPQELKAKLGGEVLELDVADGGNLLGFFSSLPGVKDLKQKGTTYRIKLPGAETALPGIFEEVSRRGLKIGRISFDKPSLDQVFLEVTGRSLRDAEAGSEDSMKARFTGMRSR
ncbi:ATP-binding cassette domain-containing protein [Candidatus Bathyarchaeota archaeon]|nr:MAG: ATP-binding cassette domain-containing protein [Candidatus Bathyarchaeota archaeon]